jgi:hypothetical protein
LKKNRLESNDILLGYKTIVSDTHENSPTLNPVLCGQTRENYSIPRNLLHRGGHIHVMGRTRSGKSARILNPLIRKLLFSYEEKGVTQDDPIFIFDLGGDVDLFHAAKSQARALKRKFRFVSLERDHAWATFDPFQEMRGEGGGSAIALAEHLANAFNLDHGLFYGGSYFSRVNLSTLLEAAKELDRLKEKASLSAIVSFIKRKGGESSEVMMCFKTLLEFPQLYMHDPENHINFARAIENSEVIYFSMPTLGGTNSARQVASLGLYSALLAAMRRVNANKEKRNIFFVIDEFQELVSRSFSSLVSQCGKFGVTLVMANQTTSQLENRDVNVADVVRDNTILKLYSTFTTKHDLENMQLLSKDTIQILKTTTTSGVSGQSSSVSEKEILAPRLQKNLALEVSSTEGCFFSFLDDGKGHNEPQILFADYGSTTADHEKGGEIERIPFEERKKLLKTNERIGWQPSANLESNLRQEGLSKLLDGEER